MKTYFLNIELYNSTHQYWHDYTVVSNKPISEEKAASLNPGRRFRVSENQIGVKGDLIYLGENPEIIANELSGIQAKLLSVKNQLQELQANEAMAKSLLVDSLYREIGEYPPKPVVVGEYLVDFNRAEDCEPPVNKIDYFNLVSDGKRSNH